MTKRRNEGDKEEHLEDDADKATGSSHDQQFYLSHMKQDCQIRDGKSKKFGTRINVEAKGLVEKKIQFWTDVHT